MIELKNVSKKYKDGTRAIHDVSFKINDGEFVYIMGPTGSGKSTLVKLLDGEEVPTKGKVIVSGIDVGRLRKSKVYLYRRKIGVVFQDYKLLPEKTVFENVAYALEILDTPRKELRKRVRDVLKLVDLADKSNSKPENLSGGQQQRTAIARALAKRPMIIIADEPTGNLDPQMTDDMVSLLEKINKEEKTTIIMVTHEISTVEKHPKRTIKLDAGHVVGDSFFVSPEKKKKHHGTVDLSADDYIEEEKKVPETNEKAVEEETAAEPDKQESVVQEETVPVTEEMEEAVKGEDPVVEETAVNDVVEVPETNETVDVSKEEETIVAETLTENVAPVEEETTEPAVSDVTEEEMEVLEIANELPAEEMAGNAVPEETEADLPVEEAAKEEEIAEPVTETVQETEESDTYEHESIVPVEKPREFISNVSTETDSYSRLEQHINEALSAVRVLVNEDDLLIEDYTGTNAVLDEETLKNETEQKTEGQS